MVFIPCTTGIYLGVFGPKLCINSTTEYTVNILQNAPINATIGSVRIHMLGSSQCW